MSTLSKRPSFACPPTRAAACEAAGHVCKGFSIGRGLVRRREALMDGAAAGRPGAAVREGARGGRGAGPDAGSVRGPRTRRQRGGRPALPFTRAAQPAGPALAAPRCCPAYCGYGSDYPVTSQIDAPDKSSVFRQLLCEGAYACAGCGDGRCAQGASEAVWHIRDHREGIQEQTLSATAACQTCKG